MKLKKLIKDIPFKTIKGPSLKVLNEVEITGLTSNSKLVCPGHLFIAKTGTRDDGVHYIPEAILAGANAILTDIYDPSFPGVVQLIHPDVKGIEPKLAAQFYENPSLELFMVGVTGTNGKTTTTFMVKHLLDAFEPKCGLIGTIEYIIGESRYPATRTTPDVISNHKMLRDMITHGSKSAVMEVTSHGLHQNRVAYIEFDTAVFTNLTPEHLDYHPSMEAYAAVKRELFLGLKPEKTALFNADSEWTPFMKEGCRARVLTYGLESPADFKGENVHLSAKGTTFDLLFEGKKYAVFTPMVGRFNVYNTLAAIGVLTTKGIELEAILEALSRFSGVPGRLEPVPNPDNRKIFVDFAHTQDALKNVIETLRELTTGKIWVVFGCGGERDRVKRPHMARTVEIYADYAIVTNDNPRSEDPEQIIAEVVKGFTESRYEVIPDRKSAIEAVLKRAGKEDIILIAGKGHEPYQIFAHKTVEFDDRKVALEAVEALI